MLLGLLIAKNDALHSYRLIFSTKLTQFSDVFGTSSALQSLTNEKRTGNNPFTPSKSDASIENCLFYDCTSSTNGGAVCCSNSVQRILIEETTFTSCKTTGSSGGGIFFKKTNGKCVIFHTCSFNCSSGSSGHYANMQTFIESSYSNSGSRRRKKVDSTTSSIQRKETDASSKNEVNESTITGIENENANSMYALYLHYGNIICSSINITNNKCCYYPALGCYPNYEQNACTCYIIYESIVNNSANGGCGCIWLNKEGSTQLISTSNIINNQQSADDDATIYTYGNLFINESCIIGNNKGKRVFCEDSSSKK